MNKADEQPVALEKSASGGGGVYALRFCLLFASCVLVPLFLLCLPPAFPVVSLVWDWANGLGYLCLGLSALLFIYTGKPAHFPPFSGRFFANLHRDLGYLCLITAVAHILLLLAIEPLLLEHLKLTAPLYMLCGLVAAVLLFLLVLSSLTPVRRYLWQHYYRFRHHHAVISTAFVVLLLVHVVGSGYYLNAAWKVATLVLFFSAVIIVYNAGKHRYRGSHLLVRLRNTQRYASLVSYGVVLLLSILMLGGLWLAHHLFAMAELV